MTYCVRDVNQKFWSSRCAPHVTVRLTQESTQRYKAHCHSELSIGIIESGETCLSMDGEDVVLGRGDAVLILPERVHACNPVNGKPRTYYMLYIDRCWCCDVLSGFFHQKVTHFQCDRSLRLPSETVLKLHRVISALMVSSSEALITEMNDILFSVLCSYCVPVRFFVNDMCLAYEVRKRLLDSFGPSVSIDEIAHDLGYSTETVIRHFKRHFGITPKSFLNNYRVEKAKSLIRNGMTIVDAALEVGYSDQSQLHRAFVHYTAATPGQFQNIRSIFDNKQ
ncbi:AraC family transcriptional regulator [Vibrio salinus]|uniref:AraC family transcriptional regulator n=1 Tax=Vibrio salinus TaxID=2899784 RepID=UPI001E53E030|nr:AraC family transcriptional regulator [Vibrio salinus]MCE0494995.1 AraC family transcriptional regulator [Vibrio salinus]